MLHCKFEPVQKPLLQPERNPHPWNWFEWQNWSKEQLLPSHMSTEAIKLSSTLLSFLIPHSCSACMWETKIRSSRTSADSSPFSGCSGAGPFFGHGCKLYRHVHSPMGGSWRAKLAESMTSLSKGWTLSCLGQSTPSWFWQCLCQECCFDREDGRKFLFAFGLFWGGIISGRWPRSGGWHSSNLNCAKDRII